MAQTNVTEKKRSPAEGSVPMPKTFNGFEMSQLQGLVDAVKRQPNLAEATLSARVEWREGFYTEAFVKDFVAGGLRNETSRSKPFIVPQDHPYELGGGTNRGATAGELLLATLGHCLSGGFANASAILGIPLASLNVEVEGEIDLHGVLGLPEPGAVQPGFQAIHANYYVRSTASREQLLAAAKMAEDLSPVKDSLRAVRFSSQLVVEQPPVKEDENRGLAQPSMSARLDEALNSLLSACAFNVFIPKPVRDEAERSVHVCRSREA